jgi:hypothetical protein
MTISQKIINVLNGVIAALMLLLVGACGTQTQTVPLPLAEDRPTFLFFFSDN